MIPHLHLKRTIPAIAAMVAMADTTSGAPSYTLQPVWSSAAAGKARAVAVGDVNRDGFLDLVVANENQRNTIYFGNGVTFATRADGASFDEDATYGMALGDVDGDGDPDLVCGNLGERNALYLNDGGVFVGEPQWRSAAANRTFDVALGDVDGDGDLDLICANENQPNQLYLNNGGALDTLPVWSSLDSRRSVCVTLGDINGDGMLDLVFGNDGQENVAYFSDVDGLSTVPDWVSSDRARTFGVALGDVTGDGNLDLACGNVLAPNTLYLGTGGGLETFSTWSSNPASVTVGIALGDTDGDGDLDLACGNFGEPNTLYLNHGTILGLDPAWSSEPTNNTFAVALCDIDADGDLDLACANHGELATVYRMAGQHFTAVTAWASTPTHSTFGVALGDVDADGDPDLVCGNGGNFDQANVLYENRNGVLTTSPVWEAAEWNSTFTIALGDINNDGRPDLVCANAGLSGQKNSIFFGDGVAFSDSAGWWSGPKNITIVIALGDVNNDGWLDLVCGNGGIHGQANTLYLNRSGVLETDPSWSSAKGNITVGVALADVDGDGWLDIVCGNNGQSNTVYFNHEGIVDADPGWVSGPAHNTFAIATGDVDGDGDPDLVCGNGGFVDQPNTLYLNDGHTLSSVPDWESDPANSSTYGITLGDVDGDGDLDIVSANESQSNTVYENIGGPEVFSRSPVWMSGRANSSFGVALGDVDRDGDLDVAFGNEGQPNTLYSGLKSPPFKHEPTMPSSHLPNSAAFLRNVTVDSLSANRVRIAFDAVDVESDRAWIHPQFQFDGDPRWFELDVVGTRGPSGPFATSPVGERDSIDWDFSKTPFDSRQKVLRLLVVENPRRVALVQQPASYQRHLGSIAIAPIRPQLAVSSDLLSYEPLSVGDSLTQSVVLANPGTAPLTIDSIGVPPEFRVNPEAPLTVAIGDTTYLNVHLEPLDTVSATGEMWIWSDDPLNPGQQIRLQADVRPLTVRTRVVAEVKLGAPLPILVSPDPFVVLDGGNLKFFPLDDRDAVTTVPLEPSDADFKAQIPVVTEVGVGFYIEMWNTPVSAVDPPGAPDAGVYEVVPPPPTAISSQPVPTFEGRFLEGRDINVLVALPAGAIFKRGLLHYRPGAGGAYTTSAVIEARPLPFAVIPDSVVGSRGLEYWVDVQTATDTLTDPGVDPTGRPYSIPVIVRDLREPLSHASMQYRLLSIPLSMQGNALESLSNEFLVKFGVDDQQWRCFTHVGGGAYTEFKGNSSGTFGFEQGRAYWLISREEHRIDTGPDQGETAPTDRAFEITLDEGYNLIGNPFNFAVDWALMQVDTMALAEAVGSGLVEYPVGIVGGCVDRSCYDNHVYDVNNPRPPMAPFDGYWVKNITQPQRPVVLRIPPVESAENGATDPGPSVAEESTAPGDWRIEITVRCGSVGGQSAVVGIRSGAAAEWDAFDRSMVPMPPGDQMAVYVPHGAWERKGPYAFDFRDGYAEGDDGNTWGQLWGFDVAKSYSDAAAGDEVVLGFDGLDEVPSEATIRLIDRKLDRSVDLRSEHRYAYYQRNRSVVSDEDDVRFVLLVGSEAYVAEQAEQLAPRPTVTTLHQNYPNPFNPSTIIRYELATPGHVRLRVYDVSGAVVKVLEDRDRPPGRYEIGWNGENERGDPVASGVYFCRLTAPNFTVTRKMILLK